MSDRKTMIIRGIPGELHDDIKNIADNLGESVSNIVRTKLRELRNNSPEHLRKPKKKY